MNQALRQGYLALIKSAVTKQAQPLPENLPWQDVFNLAATHRLVPLCYEGAVLCGAPTDTPLMRHVFVSVCRSMVESERQMAAFQQICAQFEANRIDYLPLKGAVLKPLYTAPHLRPMCDVDILVRPEQYDAAAPLMTQLGFAPLKESNHEWIWTRDGVVVELHKRLIPSYDHDLYAYFGEGWARAAAPTPGSCRYAFSPEDTWLYLFAHFAKHFRDGGIGVRHLLDLWIYRRQAAPDEAVVGRELKTLGLDVFAGHIDALANAWFAGSPETPLLADIGDYLLQSGSYGTAAAHEAAFGLRQQQEQGSAAKGKRRYLVRLLFPGRRDLINHYPTLAKHPVLLPLCWVLRWLRILFCDRGKIRRQSRRMSAIGQSDAAAFARFLDDCGLSDSFKTKR